MIRLCSYLWPFTFGVRLGWLTAGHPTPDAATACDRIFFFRGNGIVFSNGFGRMCGLLRRAGYWAEDLRCIGHRWACRHLTTHNSDGPRGRLILVGHSAGGRYAVFAARQLQDLGTTVDLLVCLDTALPAPVSANVTAAAHLYFTGPRLYPARPLMPAPDSAVRIENIDLHAPD